MMNLRTIGRYLDEEVKLMMVTQLVISKLDYCNSLYMNLPKTRLNKLRSTLNGAIRFIYNIKDRSEDLLPYYKRAHILPLDQRIFFKVCLLTYKAVYGISPAYIRNLVEIENPLTTARTRSKIEGDCYRLKTPKTTNSKIDQRRFTNYAPTTWNSLPWEIRSLRNVDIFKGRLKHYLYDRIWLVLLFIASWFVDGCIFIFGALCINISLHLSWFLYDTFEVCLVVYCYS